MEQLRNERACLEEESRNLSSRLQQLETQSKVLSERIAIQELKNGNAAKQEAINQLKSKIRLLENQLEKLTNVGCLKKEQEAKKEAVVAFAGQGEDDDAIKVTVLDNNEDLVENIGTEY
jgi:uncharacterized coiled-coil protein SlyX